MPNVHTFNEIVFRSGLSDSVIKKDIKYECLKMQDDGTATAQAIPDWLESRVDRGRGLTFHGRQWMAEV